MSDEPTVIQVRRDLTQAAFNMGITSVHEIDGLVKYIMTGEMPVEDCPPPLIERVALLEKKVDALNERGMYGTRYAGEQLCVRNRWGQ